MIRRGWVSDAARGADDAYAAGVSGARRAGRSWAMRRRPSPAYAAGFAYELTTAAMRRNRRRLEGATCAALIVATVAGIAYAGTPAAAETSRGAVDYGGACGELAPGDAMPRGCVMTVTRSGELRPVPARRIALRWLADTLPACAYDDSRNCVWNARTSGNGYGDSFVDIAGRAYYFASIGGAR